MNKYFFTLSLFFAGLGSNALPAAVKVSEKDEQAKFEYSSRAIKLIFNNEDQLVNYAFQAQDEEMDIVLNMLVGFNQNELFLNIDDYTNAVDLNNLIKSLTAKDIRVEFYETPFISPSI